LGLQDGRADNVLGGDQLQLVTLAAKFGVDGGLDRRIRVCELAVEKRRSKRGLQCSDSHGLPSIPP